MMKWKIASILFLLTVGMCLLTWPTLYNVIWAPHMTAAQILRAYWPNYLVGSILVVLCNVLANRKG